MAPHMTPIACQFSLGIPYHEYHHQLGQHNHVTGFLHQHVHSYTHYEIEGTEIQGTVLKFFKNKGHQYSNF